MITRTVSRYDEKSDGELLQAQAATPTEAYNRSITKQEHKHNAKGELISKPKAKYIMRRRETFNTLGTMYQAVFISIVMIVVAPMRCYEHPNGESSMVDRAGII